MMRRGKAVLSIGLSFSCLVISVSLALAQPEPPPPEDYYSLTETQIQRLEDFLQKQMAIARIPGLAVAIVKGDRTVYTKGFGFSNVESGRRVSSVTLFQLGDCSLPFTALGILKLEQEGKLRREDAVEHYLPWLEMRYRGEPVILRISHLLYHTSGFTDRTVVTVPSGQGGDTLERTVRALSAVELHQYPGFEFSYASINYDVLALIIQKVSGQSFESYVARNLLTPLGLKNTYLVRWQARLHDLAVGYKITFNRLRPYGLPLYRVHTPAYFFVSSSDDLVRWLKIQIGAVPLPENYRSLIEASQVSEPGSFGSSYARGWFLTRMGRRLDHGGRTPNFSAFLIFEPEAKVGVVVLANLNTDMVKPLTEGILEVLDDKRMEMGPRLTYFDRNQWVDDLSIKILYGTLLLLVVIVLLLVAFFSRFHQKGRKFSTKGIKGPIFFIITALLWAAGTYGLYIFPRLLGVRLTRKAVKVWLPESFIYAVVSAVIALFLAYIYLLLKFFFPPMIHPRSGK